MQALSGFARKYAIMEELDEGFGAGSTPEAFVRLDSWEGRIQASLNVKGLRQGPYTYKLYLIFAKGDKLIPILTGSLNISYSGMQGGLEIESETLKSNGIRPETVRYAAITAENQDKKWIPLFSSFEKSYRWDESIRQVLLKKQGMEEEKQKIYAADHLPMDSKPEPLSYDSKKETDKSKTSSLPETKNTAPEQEAANITDEKASADSAGAISPPGSRSGNIRFNKCDICKLEGYLRNNFEEYEPFKRSNRSYMWYRVSDLAKLSNIMYMSGVNVPVFANPKILVGLFKYKHILAGLYRGGNGSDYYVIGIPAKDEKDNKPFEHACRWVPVMDSNVRDMGGYWLVYVSLRSGEIVV